MDNARIEQVGGPAELYDRPANPFVMGFLGPVTKLGNDLVRPHDITIKHEPRDGRARGAWSRASPSSASRSAWS